MTPSSTPARVSRHRDLEPPPPAYGRRRTARRSRMHPTAINPTPRYLRTPDAARLLGLSPRTLEKHRTFGTGPTYHKLGGRIVYAVEDLQAWADLGLRRSTSDPGQGVVHPAKRLDPPGRLGAAHR